MCNELYDNKSYAEALEHCLNSTPPPEFRLGYIYGSMGECDNSHKWYEKSGEASALMNIGIHFLNGSRGCLKSLNKAKDYFERSIEKSANVGNYYFLGRYFAAVNERDEALNA